MHGCIWKHGVQGPERELKSSFVIVKILLRSELPLIWYQNEVHVFKIGQVMVVKSGLVSNTWMDFFIFYKRIFRFWTKYKNGFRIKTEKDAPLIMSSLLFLLSLITISMTLSNLCVRLGNRQIQVHREKKWVFFYFTLQIIPYNNPCISVWKNNCANKQHIIWYEKFDCRSESIW